MKTQKKSLTPEEVCSALGLTDFDDYDETDGPSAVQIAEDMLNGVVRFTAEDLEKLAAFKGITVRELQEQFGVYWNMEEWQD